MKYGKRGGRVVSASDSETSVSSSTPTSAIIYDAYNSILKKKKKKKEIRVVWRYFSTLQRRNKLKFDKQRTILHQIQYIIIFDFFDADHSILIPGIATQNNTFTLVLATIQRASKSLVGRGNTRSNGIKFKCR